MIARLEIGDVSLVTSIAEVLRQVLTAVMARNTSLADQLTERQPTHLRQFSSLPERERALRIESHGQFYLQSAWNLFLGQTEALNYRIRDGQCQRHDFKIPRILEFSCQPRRGGVIYTAMADLAHLTEVLRQWQDLNRRLAARPRRLPSWGPASRLIASALKLDTKARAHLSELLDQSNRLLSPLRDPLELNLGEHRWLSVDREESYSDWLGWILQGMPDVSDILPLFDLENPGAGKPRISREEKIHEESRTDVVVRFGQTGLLLIEVKTRPTGLGLGGQLRRYSEWARKEVADPLLALVALEKPEPLTDLHGFEPTLWGCFSRRLRQYACRLKESDLMQAAVILAFCGAVEQNLLRISADPQPYRAMASIDYFRTWNEASR
jgi:hypothetical protein